MSETIEGIDAAVLSKISSLKSFLRRYADENLSLEDASAVARAFDKLAQIEASYSFGTSHILNDYFSIDVINDATPENIEKKNNIHNIFVKFLMRENVLGALARIFDQCKKIAAVYKCADFALGHYISEFESHMIAPRLFERPSMFCGICGRETICASKTSEKICNHCGRVERIYGTVFEEDQFFSADNKNGTGPAKHGRYDPTNHCRYWIECIQAEEKIDIPDALLDKIRYRIRQDKQILSELNCAAYRRYLKEIECTKFNDHVPLIRKRISGITPPQLSDNEKKMISLTFSRIVHVFNRVKPLLKTTNKSNCPYHPYFIYKIIEHMLSGPVDAARRREILSCIHLQSRETLIENDNIMEIICTYMPELVYRPTRVL